MNTSVAVYTFDLVWVAVHYREKHKVSLFYGQNCEYSGIQYSTLPPTMVIST